MSWFGGGGKSSKPNKGDGQWVEMQTYRHDRPGVDGGGRGEIENPQGSASYDRNAHDLTVHGIVSAAPGGGAFLMQQIAEDAQQMGKPFVRTTMTAPSALGFYHRMGMLPSQASKTMGELSMARTEKCSRRSIGTRRHGKKFIGKKVLFLLNSENWISLNSTAPNFLNIFLHDGA